jgi:uncharacterized coiled-coil DUF342 family protein
MSELCIIEQCRRTSRASCKCCKQDLCLQHFWEHNDLVISQLNPLKNEINGIDSRFQTIDIQKLITAFRQQIKQWRIDSYTIIDRFCEQKCREFNQYINEKVEKQREEIDQLQKQIDEFIRTEIGCQQDIDFITSNINNLKEKMDKIEQTLFSINISSLVVDENLIPMNN